MNRNNNYVLITGATSGIGYELAKIFAGNKNNFVIVARDQEVSHNTAEEFTQQYGIIVEVIQADLFNPENAFNVYAEVTATAEPEQIIMS